MNAHKSLQPSQLLAQLVAYLLCAACGEALKVLNGSAKVRSHLVVGKVATCHQVTGPHSWGSGYPLQFGLVIVENHWL